MVVTKNNKIVSILLLLSLVASLGYSFWHRIEPAVDAVAYDRIALNLLSGNGFREDATVPFEFDTAMLRAGPGYEFFLAAIYFIFGHHYEAVWIIQALLHVATAWFVYKTARILWPDQELIGIIAAGIIGLHPDLIEISAMLMTETLYLFFVALIMYLFSRAVSGERSWYIASLLGLMTGVGMLTRPTLLLFVPIMVIFFVVRKKWLETVLCIASVILVLIPWTTRNFAMYERVIPTTLIGDFNIWIGNTPHSNGGQISGGFNPVTTYVAEYGVRDLSETANKEFLSFIKDKPGTFIELTSIRFVRYVSLIRPMGFWFYDQGVSQIVFICSSLVAIAILFVTGFTGMVLMLINQKNKIMWYLVALALTAPVPLLLTVVQSRYRFQIYPFLALFGAYCIAKLIEKQPLAWKWFKIILGILIVVSLIDSIFFWPTIEAHMQSLFSI